jgi:hypothetical protein
MPDHDISRGAAADDDVRLEGNLARRVVALYDAWYARERENVDLAYEDLRFSREGVQWPDALKRLRDEEGRPALTVNKCPQYVRQVTGDIRMARPAIKVTPVDDRGDEATAAVLAGLIRYVENRSDAQAAYALGCDAQVTAGVGAWQVVTEYAGDDTFELELAVLPVDDPVAIAWDGDSALPTREDATWCIVPVDLSHAAFKKRFPKASLSDFDNLPTPESSGWWSDDTIRVATYWAKEPVTRRLALMPDGAVVDLTDRAPAEARRIEAAAERVEMRKSHKVTRTVVSAAEVLEGPTDWPGKLIPIVPVIGEEIRIGRRVYRNGLIRFAKESQRIYNYALSTNVEVVALQPKSPFIGTEKNFEKYQDEWAQANRKNQPYLPYTPDPANGSLPPQRVQPAVSSSGLAELMGQAANDMKAVTGLYDAALGARSNETSGRAILARQREGDVSTYVYLDNFARAVRHTGKILIDLIPKLYDTPRTLRIIGEDGRPARVAINQKAGEELDATGKAIDVVANDVTVGAYDVVLETGPAFSTRREEAREGMTAFLQGNPAVAPLVLDLVADAQAWPNSDKIAKRLRTLLPPQVQAMEAAERGEGPAMPPGGPGVPPPTGPLQPPPDPLADAERQIKVQLTAAQARKADAEAGKAELELRVKELELQALIAQLGVGEGQRAMPPEPGPPSG